jgi:ABC-2 type transport system permease protein
VVLASAAAPVPRLRAAQRDRYVTEVILWQYRSALRLLVNRDLHVKYRTLRLGYLWAILEPLGLSVVMWFVFEVLLGGRKFGLHPYYLFLTVAILPWWWFVNGISACTRVYLGATRTLTVSQLPTQFNVARVLLARTADFMLSLPLVVAAMLITWTFPGPTIIFYPVAVVIQFAFMYGLALLVASVSAIIPDIARIIRIFLRAAFYLTPVLYSLSNIPEGARGLAHVNPLVGILGLYRVGWWPNEHEGATAYLTSFAVIAVVIVIGWITFRKIEHRILKEA